MKINNIQKILILLCLTIYISCGDEGKNYINQYKDLKSPMGHHSLYSGHNGDNVSTELKGVPPPVAKKGETPKSESPERSVAERLVDFYRKQFDFLDAQTVNDLVDAEELAVAYRDFEWPKTPTDVADDTEYAKTQINRYDKEGKGGLNFVDFCMFAEDLWEVSDSIQEQKCQSSFEKAMEIWDGFFKWLDRDSDGKLVMEDMIYGISKMMHRDADMEEVQKVLNEYGGQERKINYDSFVLAIANGMLDKSLKDSNFTADLGI
jgi:Ca2+-binding EF-hand superfamily protein